MRKKDIMKQVKTRVDRQAYADESAKRHKESVERARIAQNRRLIYDRFLMHLANKEKRERDADKD